MARRHQKSGAELEATYWGAAEPPELREDEGNAAQLVLPLWSAGYAVV